VLRLGNWSIVGKALTCKKSNGCNWYYVLRTRSVRDPLRPTLLDKGIGLCTSINVMHSHHLPRPNIKAGSSDEGLRGRPSQLVPGVDLDR